MTTAGRQDARRLRVTTWNVLHRVHAVNWKEAPVAAFPFEPARIAGITGRIASWLDDGVSIVCLQEVSGDQLASLRSMLGTRPGAELFEHTYPRVPRIRGPEPLELADPKEHLVAIVNGGFAALRGGRTSDADPGKGFLEIDLGDDVSLIDTHVSARERGPAQMLELAAAAQQTSRAIVTGDFNAPAEVVRTAFGDAPAISDVAGQGFTRIPTADHEGRTIDHVIVFGGTIVSATVLDGELLSDHNPVSATVAFG